MSNEPTIEQMNEAIAKFMGFEVVQVGYSDTEEETEWQKNHEEWMHKVKLTQVGQYIVNVKKDIFHTWDDIKYHLSWDWLMPVVTKIKGLIHDADHEKRFQMSQRLKPIQNETLNVNVTNTHYCVYRFIQWNNNQSTTTNDTTAGN